MYLCSPRTLAAPSPNPAPPAIDLDTSSASVGRYVLLSTLGRGGMGVVYAAYDPVLDRRVAIKVLRVDGPLTRMRLRREAQVLARLTHPHVVRIYEILEHATFDCIVMELVEGVTLTRWVRGAPRDRQAILAAFEAAGRGLQAAHAKGIVHRDFKPDNAMIRASDGQVLVMDFGLAHDERSEPSGGSGRTGVALFDRAESSPGFDSGPDELGDDEREHEDQDSDPSQETRRIVGLTRVGAVMGTVGYMAPEQASGAFADPRSDQFSFCAALWEALYQERPFASSNLERYREALASGRPREPVRDLLPSWQRAVLERGLAIDPSERWPSMGALLDALTDDPTRRRRRGLCALGLVGVFAVAGAGLWASERQAEARQHERCEAAAAQIESSWNPAIEARLAEAFAASDAPSSASAWTVTHRWLDGYARELAEHERATCLAEQDETEPEASASAAVHACLDDHRIRFEALVAVLEDSDGPALLHAAEVAASLPPVERCASAGTDAIRPAAPGPASQRRPLLGRIYRAEILQSLGELDEASDAATAALAEAEALGWAPAITAALLTLARDGLERGEFDDGERLATRAFHKAVIAGDGAGMVEAATVRAQLAAAAGRLDDAELWRASAEELLGSHGLGHSRLPTELAMVASQIAFVRGDLPQARRQAERALELAEARLGPDHPGLSRPLTTLAQVLDRRQDHAGARAVFARVLELDLRAYGPDSLRVATAYNNYGAALQNAGEPERAREYYRLGLLANERTLGPDNIRVGLMLCNLGLLAHDEGDLELALGYFERGTAIMEAQLGPEHSGLIKPLVNLGTIASRRGEHELALARFTRVTAILTSTSTAEFDERELFVRASHADALVRAGQFEAADPEYARSLRVAEQIHGPDSAQVVRPLLGLANVDIEQGRRDRAAARLARAEVLIDLQPGRAWVLAFAQAKLRWAHGERGSALAEVEALRHAREREGDRYGVEELDRWLAGANQN